MANTDITKTNFLDFTKLTYSDIVDQVTAKLAADPRFENFRESAIAQTIIGIFAGMTDMINYYIERRAEENYLDTAKLKSSLILLARQIGYIITRPIPATTNVKILIKGPLPAYLVTGDTFSLELFKNFTFNGMPFICANTYTYTFTSADVATGIGNVDFEKELPYSLKLDDTTYQLLATSDVTSAISEDLLETIDLYQGEQKTYEIVGVKNAQVGQAFQTYKIDDNTFCNKYGSEDYGEGELGSSYNVTKVLIGLDEATATEIMIDRRSIFSFSYLKEFGGDPLNACVIRTATDENIELLFGDGTYSIIGATTTNDNIFVKYLSTLGAKANKIGVIDEKITCESSILVDNDINKDITTNISFVLNGNILGGGDIETNESIKFNASKLFYALDRVVTKDDYINFLKSLTSPIVIKNAIAWGEHEEGSGEWIKKFFNMAMFSCVGALYKTEGDVYKVKTKDSEAADENLKSAVLDDIDNMYTTPPNHYFNILIKENSNGEIGEVTLPTGSDITTVLTQLNRKSQTTVKNVYISPVIHEFEIGGTVYIKKLANAATLLVRIRNSIYKFLNENADFNVEIYKSNIIEIIESFTDVVNADIEITPSQPVGDTFELPISADTTLNDWALSGTYVGLETSATVIEAISSGIDEFATFLSIPISPNTWDAIITATDNTDLTETNYGNYLIKNVYDNLYALVSASPATDISASFCESEYFAKIQEKMHNALVVAIKTNILDANQNIVEYTLNIEIPVVTFTANLVYK